MKPPLQVPVAFGHWLVAGDKLQCRLPRRTVTVRAPRKLLVQITMLCDGSRTWPQVIESLEKDWSSETVTPFMLALSTESVLVESGELWAHWSDIAQLPQPGAIGRESPEEIARLSQIAENRLLPDSGICEPSVQKGENSIAAVLKSRESHRTFDDRPLTVQSLCSVLWAAHGVARKSDREAPRWHRTVGSGGNMHSARWFVAVLRTLPSSQAEHSPLAVGLYEARFHVDGGASLQPVGADVKLAWNCLRDPRVLRYASALILPLYDVAIPARKYGNRATLFATLEAGLCLQNAQLMAASLDAACMLRGDTVASAVIELAGVERTGHHWLSVPGMVVGAMPSLEQTRQQALESRFAVAPNLLHVSEFDTQAPQFAFTAGPEAGTPGLLLAGSGRASDPSVAMRIAEAEAWERNGWATLGAATEASFDDLPRALDPIDLVAYSTRQHRAPRFPFLRFDRARRYLWVDSVDAETGAVRAVPAECVHALHALPAAFQATACTSTSTSGVAAGTSVDDALMRATLEIVERDAFCCAWLSGSAYPGIQPETLPAELQRRLQALAAIEAECSVIDLSTPWCAVIAIFLQVRSMPFTAITAAAAFDKEFATAKALSEAEGRLAFAENFPPEKPEGEAMRAIEAYYRNVRTYRRSDFFRPAQNSRRFPDVATSAAQNWAQMQTRLREDGYRLMFADITPAGAAIDQGRQPLSVVRALVPGLVPIWFHRGLQPEGLRRFSTTCGVLKGRSAGLFIHPFT